MALLKSFAAGVMLGTAFVHILPDSFQALTHPCLLRRLPVCARFPFAGFASMLAALLTLMAEIAGTARAHRRHHHHHHHHHHATTPSSLLRRTTPPHECITDTITELLAPVSPSTQLPANPSAAGAETAVLPSPPPNPPPATATVDAHLPELSTSSNELLQLIMPRITLPPPPDVAMAVYLNAPDQIEMRNLVPDPNPNLEDDHAVKKRVHKDNVGPFQSTKTKRATPGKPQHSALELDDDDGCGGDDDDDHHRSRGRPAAASIAEKLRRRVIAQVLELGIVAHSIIIGISLGTSQSPCTIRPLIVALIFHQFFEGIALGGSIAEAEYESHTAAIMAFLFSMTSPVGIAIGMGIASGYNESSPTALLVEGLFDSISAGILVYMSLVDLIATDFRSENMLRQPKLQVYCYSALFLGAGAMSLLATWA